MCTSNGDCRALSHQKNLANICEFCLQMIPYLIDQHNKGNYPLEKIVTMYDVEDFATAIRDTKEGKTIKAVLQW